MNEPLYTAPLAPQHRKSLGQGVFVAGLAFLAFGAFLLIEGFTWPLGGRERDIDLIVMAIFGPKYANEGMAAFFIAAGIWIGYKGWKVMRKGA